MLNWDIVDVFEKEFDVNAIVPIVEVVHGQLRITIPTDTLGQTVLPRGSYLIRVFYDVNDELFGIFVIENGGRYVNPGGNGGMATVMIVFALLFGIGFAGMMVTPRVITRMQQRMYEETERKRFKNQFTKDELTTEYAGSTKRVMSKKEMEKLTDAEKETLFKERTAAAKDTKGSRFLSKMAENKAKREFAREAGLTMDEYKEMEEKARQVEASKEASLSAFRKAVEEKTGVYTKQQETEAEEKVKADAQAARPKRSDGRPEFDLLDSEKGRGEIPPEYKKEDKVADGDHWKGALKEAETDGAPKKGYGGFEEEIARLERGEQSGVVEKVSGVVEVEPEVKVEEAVKPPEKKEEGGGSILQRLRRLTGEDT